MPSLCFMFIFFTAFCQIQCNGFRVRKVQSSVYRCNTGNMRCLASDPKSAEHIANLAANRNGAVTIGLGSSVFFMGPAMAAAVAEPSAREALQLLSGYQTRTPNSFTWFTIAVLVYILSFEIWKKVVAAW